MTEKNPVMIKIIFLVVAETYGITQATSQR